MTFNRALKLSSHLLLLAGFGTLWSAGGVGIGLTLLFLLGLALSWRERGLSLPNWLQLLLVIVFFGTFLVDASFVSGFVSATVHLLIFISFLKLISRKVDRDYLLLYFMSFAFILMASTFTISISFLAALVGYLFFAILTFILFESKAAYDENRSVRFHLKGYLQGALVITSLIVLLSIPIFVLIPRGTAGLLHLDRQQGGQLSGFSDRVSLGDIGRILTNPAVVMRVKLDHPRATLPEEPKWRGIALDHYDGRVWTNTSQYRRRIQRDDTYQGFLVERRRRSADEEFLIRQNVYLEPISNVLFGAPGVVMISGAELEGAIVFEDGNDSYSLYHRGPEPLRYVVDSDLQPRGQQLSRPVSGAVPESIRQRYLQLPDLDPRIHRLARDLTPGNLGDPARALLIERHLRHEFGYSLENRSALAEDPLADFLFETREGHCEYFATAQAVLMRSLRIPARLVNGFRTGEFNRWGEYYLVRQSDAHSWVEGYFPGVGWVEFDPTPPSGTRSRRPVTLAVTHFLDAVDVFWTEVVTFDRFKQAGLFRALAARMEEAAQGAAALVAHLESYRDASKLNFGEIVGWTLRNASLPALFVGLALLLLYFRRSVRLFLDRRILRKDASELAPHYYREMLELLRRKGHTRRPSETPAEFASRVRARLENDAPVRITELYYRARFGALSLQEREWGEIESSLRDLRRLPWNRGPANPI